MTLFQHIKDRSAIEGNLQSLWCYVLLSVQLHQEVGEHGYETGGGHMYEEIFDKVFNRPVMI